MRLADYLLKNRKEKQLRLFFDIETLQYNETEGKERPSQYKNVTYSVAVSYFNEHDLHVSIFPNFYEFFQTILTTYSKWKTTPKIELIAHNNNKYDNHFLRNDLLYYYNHMIVKNMFLKNASDEGNALSFKEKDLTKEEKQGVILEKRIKSANNLELIFYLNGIRFYTTDNFMKTNVSIATLGKKLLRINAITEDELKTDFNYTEFNKSYDMTDEEARDYALEVFNSLTEKHLTYIRNDVIILGQAVMNYSKIFKGFDYDKITFTSNILEFYNDNDLTSYQLLKKVGQGKDTVHIKYTDYRFANENFYDYLKSFYSGGLNFYNQKYLGQIIKEPMFSIDINSSYPYVMHHFKVPTFLREYKEFEKETEINVVTHDDIYTLYRMTKKEFDYAIISKIDSVLIRQILVKYYNKNDFININSYTIRMIENITGIKINKLKVTSYVTFDCVYFGSRDKIEEKYYVKTQGSNDKKIKMKNPYEITLTEEENTERYSKEEIDNAKVLLNGLYGIPALRAYFNLFRTVGNEIINVPNGYKNSERNIVFSTFVTSVSLYNLLSPLKHLTQQEIDDNLIYTDTDSLYLKQAIRHKIPKDIYHSMHLGKWDIQDDKIDYFYVLNHKKYAYEAEGEIIIKCGGIPQNSFNRNMPFEEFIETQFNNGAVIHNTKSIFNDQGTISIYPSKTVLDIGQGYRLFTDDPNFQKNKEKLLEEIRNETGGNIEDALYIESSLGTFSMSDMYPLTHEVRKKLPLLYYEIAEDEIKNLLSY